MAVLATPLDRVYPKSNLGLFNEIVASGGALLSEQPLGGPVVPAMFVQRNRLIAALACAVVVVRAPLKSGALSTAKWAQVMNIPLFFVPAAPWDPRGAGCLVLARRGARICTSAQDVLSDAALRTLKLTPSREKPTDHDRTKMSDINELDADSQAVLRCLATGSRHSEQLAAELGFSAKRVQQALVMLCLDEHVVEKGAGRYGLGPRRTTVG